VDGKKQTVEMLGEFLREAAVLVLVFVPLELATKTTISTTSVVGVVLFSAAVLAAGITLERSRNP